MLFCLATGIIIYTDENKKLSIYSFSETSTRPLIIIDAGHGGADGGAVAPDGSAESEINLDIALKTECIADFLGVENIMTRKEEALPYPEDAVSIAEKKRWDQMSRLELINSQSNSILISIHQNIYADPRPRGPQVLYSAAAGSAELGEICHGLLNANLCPENRRVAAPISDRIFLMKNSYLYSPLLRQEL